jgi:hypothetical protein
VKTLTEKFSQLLVKLPAHSAGLPGNDLLFNIAPLDPAHRAGLAGHAPVNDSMIVQLGK